MASTATLLGVMNLFFAIALNRSMAFLIFMGMIGFAVVAAGGRKRRNRESSSSSSSSGIKYEVFLSFRGEDTRKGFTDHLYSRLVDAGIDVFRDNEGLRGGEEIHPRLKEAIKGSKISIAVFSKDYASSKSCLMEVVQMWECRKSKGQTIIPIFYDISPYDVKRQAGDFGRSFNQHVRDGVNADTIKKWKEVFRRIGGLSEFNLHVRDGVNADTIKKWKEVLRRIGGLSGFNRENINGGHESQLVKKVLRRVRQVLKKDDRVVTDKLVGIDLHVQEMMRKLGVVYSDGQVIKICGGDVRVVGLWGIRGVGKTTLAKVVYNKMHMLFDECCFLDGINLEGVVSSQERLIASLQQRKREALNSYDDGIKKMESLFTNKKVLIVLDDVREDNQFQGLAGKLTWFGPGSRIIVTTNTRNVLNGFDGGAVEVYEVGQMRHHHALQLFRKHAFQGDAPQDVSEFDSLSIDIVKAIGGLPKAIEIQASYLSQKRGDIEAWTNTLDSLERHPPEGVKTLFDIGYQSLDHHIKKIFLDIACFFVGNDERIPTYMWKACDCYRSMGIDPLRNLRWLEEGENNELRMDNLIRDFGRDIVKTKVVHKRCRFWNHSDALSILENHPGTVSVEGIGLTVEEGCTNSFNCEQFSKMSDLRYLRLDRAKIEGDTRKLPPNLRWLDWRECHLIPELCNMHLKELVILDLSWSPVTKDSKLWSQFIMKVEKLKVLNLRGCGLLGAALNFPAPINLEILILEDCTLLSEIGTFISKLKNLKSLNLRNCKKVKQLPEEQHCMKSLTELLIDGTGIEKIQIQIGSLEKLEVLSACDCKGLKDISTIGRLRNLSSLALDGADIVGLPDTFEFPRTLKRLSLSKCRKLVKLPRSIGNLKVLEEMDLSDTAINEMPSSVKELTELKTLKMARTHLKKFPGDIVKLAKLEEIDFSFCVSLESKVRCDISKLSSLRILRLSSSNVAGLPKSICHLSHLQHLEMLDCNQLHALPKLPSSLLRLYWGSKNMTVPDLSYLTNLKELLLTDGEQPKAGWLMMLLNLITPNIGWITRLPSLETLHLSLSKVTYLPRNFSALTQLRELSLSHMKELDLTQLPLTSSLSTLCLKHCKIRKPRFSSLQHLSELELDDCDLAEIDGLKDLKVLEVLKISRCRSITNLNGLERVGRFRKVEVFSSPLVVLPELSECVEKARCD